ncbi:unnamed protein product [Fusarium venenatum]|uniref:Uncharacterized protein n=1 Tax=Fusarium venenatum TaxID=56646 RepID=A0A2L2SQC6_9HYPO|nr:uncharacterized protein FVRRES_12915 [Fusarium venenatum]CEI40224.1 unnamed protein product [Fusarium venenatum]
MASITSSASCTQPPLSLLVEKPCQLNTFQTEQVENLESSGFSSPGSDGKPFTPRTRQRLKDYLCNSNSVAVSSVDEHTPPIDPPKPILKWDLVSGAKHPVKIIPRQYKQVRYATPDGYARPAAIKVDDDLMLPPNTLPHAMRQTWARYPPPANEDFSVDEEFSFTPKFLANEIDPEGPLERFKQRNKANFVQPLCLQGTIRNEYAAHLADKQHDHDELMERVVIARRAKAENDAIKLYSFNRANEPIKFPVLGPKAQKKIYDEKVNMSALTRKIAICDGNIEGMIAGEFTYNKDTAHLPPTEEQVAILREAGGLGSFFPKAPLKPSIYDQWLEGQSANPCPASNWLNDEEKFAKKKAFESALSGQLKSRFPSKPIDNKMPTKLHRSDEPIYKDNNFPYMLPKTSTAPEHNYIYETPVAVQVPKWLSEFVDSDIVSIDKSASDEKQYKELLTTIWKLESHMLKETKPNKQAAASGNAAWILESPSSKSFAETKPNQNLPETDVIIGEFSFDDAFTFGQDIGAEIPDKSSALLLKEIAEGVKKAIAKVGM